MRMSKRWTLFLCAMGAMMVVGAERAHAQGSGGGSLSRSSTTSDQPEFRVYDVSDLLPAEVRDLEPVGISLEKMAELKSRGREVGMERTKQADIAQNVASTMGFDAWTFGPAVVGVLASPEEHEAFSRALDALHDAYSDRVSVRVALYEVDPNDEATVGGRAGAEWGNPVREIAQALHRRVATPMRSISVHGFASDVNVITGTGGLGYEPQIGSSAEGLTLDVRVGYDDNDGSLVDLRGEFTTVQFRPSEMRGYINNPNANIGQGIGPFELATVNRRSIHSAVRVRSGVETIVSVMDDPDSENQLVVTVRLSLAP